MKTQNYYGLTLCLLSTFFLVFTSCNDDDREEVIFNRSLSPIEVSWENPIPVGSSVVITIEGTFANGDILQVQTKSTDTWKTIHTWQPAGRGTGPEIFTYEFSNIPHSMQVRALTTGIEGKQIITNSVSIETD